jgi:hypothetical protein
MGLDNGISNFRTIAPDQVAAVTRVYERKETETSHEVDACSRAFRGRSARAMPVRAKTGNGARDAGANRSRTFSIFLRRAAHPRH